MKIIPYVCEKNSSDSNILRMNVAEERKGCKSVKSELRENGEMKYFVGKQNSFQERGRKSELVKNIRRKIMKRENIKQVTFK